MKFHFTISVPIWLVRVFLPIVLLYRRLRYGFPFRRIPLTRGFYAIVDPDDFIWLSKFKWCVSKGTEGNYAVRNVRIGRRRTKMLLMHREIMKSPEELFVDHRNNDGLDNRKANLRPATHSQNMFNRRKTRKKTSSRFIGVCFDKYYGRWLASICCHGKSFNLGRFDNEIDAAKAHDRAAREYHKEFARLNFPK